MPNRSVSLDSEADRTLTALHRIENDVRRTRDEPRISRSGLACRAIRVYALTLAQYAQRKERKNKSCQEALKLLTDCRMRGTIHVVTTEKGGL
jgi:hypothetical protein